MTNNTIIRDLIKSGRKIIDIIPATPMTDTTIVLERGYSIQYNRNEGIGIWHENTDGTYTSYPIRQSANEIFADMEKLGI